MELFLAELVEVVTPAWWQANATALLKVIMIDLVLAGDNAVIVGLAASRVAPEMRAKVIFWGIAGAVILRILFALVTAQLLAIPGLLLFGGLLLFYVCWKMYLDLTAGHKHELNEDGTISGASAGPAMGFGAALWSIILADVTMSLDNVLAVAGAAKGSSLVLVIGLAIAVIMMAVASHYIARLLTKYPLISWVGLAIVIYVAADMTYKGTLDLMERGKFASIESVTPVVAWLSDLPPMLSPILILG